MARTKRESKRRRREVKWQTCWCCRDQQRACRIAQASAEQLNYTGPTEKERVASMPQKQQLASTKTAIGKEKKQSRLSRALHCEREENQGEREPHFVEREGIKAEAWGRMGGLHSEGKQVPRRRGMASKESFPRRSRRKYEGVGGRKSFPRGPAESWFYSKSGQT